MSGENIGRTSQALVGGSTLSEQTQETFGLVTLGASCSACLLRPQWVVAAAHCLEVDDADGNPIPDPDRPGQNRLVGANSVTVSASWGGGQTRQSRRIETFRPYDVALIELDAPFTTQSIPEGTTRMINGDQFPYFGSEGGMALTIFGRGIHQFATDTTPSSSDGQYRVGYATVNRTEAERYWYASASGDYIAGGDSGGPSFAWTLSGYALVGVHHLTNALYAADKPRSGWMWVTATLEAADAPLRPLADQLMAVMGPATPAPPPAGFIGTFATGGPSAEDEAIESVRHRASLAGERGFAAGFPNFHYARYGLDHVGGTIWIRPEGVEWRNPLLSEVGVENPRDFGDRMRAAAQYASANGLPAGLPTFLDADFGDGLRSGIFLLRPEVAEWQDVPIYDLNLHEEDLGDVGKRFRATNDYAFREGYVGGFPTMFHATKTWLDPLRGGQRTRIVCGTVLLRAPLAQWEDVLLFRDPR